ncbi:MAG: hypothetical protein IKW51_09770 [Bacteroidales bacterium]|nr:hypothetical protein [Bacteroidales bacterium]
MYNEQLEQLIDAALADGVLTEKEKQILFKKAQTFGIDLDEFEMVLDARLVKLQKEQQSAPKSNKLGDVKKCPACGAIVQSFNGVCIECGYEFSGVEANSSSKKLAKKIEEINERQIQKAAGIDGPTIEDKDKKWEIMGKERIMSICHVVKSFPIPNTKTDMFEFITTMQSNMLSPDAYKLEADAYYTKYNEAIIKASALYKNDSTFSSLIENKKNVVEEYKKIHRTQKKFGMKPSGKMTVIMLSLLVGIMLMGVVGAFVFDA